VVGEGGSGGALGIAVADRVAMMQYAWYSVISPEGCASILWKEANPQTTEQSADSLKLTAADNLKFGVVDEIISEPLGGAHRKPKAATEQLEKWLVKTLRDLKRFKVDNLTNKRFERLRTMGDVAEG
jgi:acetyl-CoA carboxylase carboxyl transferase subunit alpha